MQSDMEGPAVDPTPPGSEQLADNEFSGEKPN